MAFNLANLVRSSAGSAPRTATGSSKNSVSDYIYASDDDVAAVATAGYFNGARDVLVKGDKISCRLDLDATPILREYIVTAAPATGNVTIAAQNVA